MNEFEKRFRNGSEDERKQVIDLEQSILRLCEHADSSEIIFNSLFSTIVTVAEIDRVTPENLIEAFTFYVQACVTKNKQLRKNRF